MDKHIIVFTWVYKVTKWIKNQTKVLILYNTDFKILLYSSHIWQNKDSSMFGSIFNTKNANEKILTT